MSFTENQKATLLIYFDNGMVGIGKKFQDQITAACAETSLSEKQVKNWIAKQAHKRKPKVLQKTTQEQASSTSTGAHVVPRKDRTKCGWNMFQKEYAATDEGKNVMKEGIPAFNRYAAVKFKEMPAEEKHRYDQLAVEGEDVHLTETQVSNKIKNIFTKLRNNTCKKLEEYGCPTLVIGFRKDNWYIAESDSISNKLSSGMLQQLHHCLFNSNEPQENNRKCAEEEKLRRDVQELFNTKYREATRKDAPFPYKRKSEFSIDGLPAEVPFRKPSSYGVGQLRKIIESRDNIKVRIREATPATTHPETSCPGPMAFSSFNSPSHSPVSSSCSITVPVVTSFISPSTSSAISLTSGLCGSSSSSSATTHDLSFPSLTSSSSSNVVSLSSSSFSQDCLVAAEHPLLPVSSPSASQFSVSLSSPPVVPVQDQTPISSFFVSTTSSSPPLVVSTFSSSLESSCTISSSLISSASSSSVQVTTSSRSLLPIMSVHDQPCIPEQTPSSPSTSITSPISSQPCGERRHPCKRPGQKPKELPVYPFWSKVQILKDSKDAVVAEGIIVPGSNSENSCVNNEYQRKIYVTKVSDDVEGSDSISGLKEGSYTIQSFKHLIPTVGTTQGVGGLIDFPIKRNGRKLKLGKDQEELCEAKSCQVPQAHNSPLPDAELPWVLCESPQCRKWFHLQCVGVEENAELPRRWFCGCSKFTRENILGSKKTQYHVLGDMLAVFPEVESHLRNVITQRVASIRHVIWTKYNRREIKFINEHLFAGHQVPFNDNLFEAFFDIVMGLFVSQKLTDDKTERIDYCHMVLIPEALVKFAMVVEGLHRHIAEEFLFNWTDNMPTLLGKFILRK